MVSVDTLASVARRLHWPKCFGPTKRLKPASQRENKSNETCRETARTSKRRRGNSFGDRQKRRIRRAAAVDGVDDLFARMLVRGGHDPRGEIDAHLDNLASRDAEVVLLEIGARDSRR